MPKNFNAILTNNINFSQIEHASSIKLTIVDHQSAATKLAMLVINLQLPRL